MSLKDLFKQANAQYLASKSLTGLTGSVVESAEYIDVYEDNKERFIPLVDYSQPKNFARFGSAEKYYYDSINYIADTYPYDGSKKEKIQWELSSSVLDLFLFENGYPRTTGYANFLVAAATSGEEGTYYYPPAGGTNEYIFVLGGPHSGSGQKIHINPDTGEAHYREDANIWDTAKNRECNLKIGGTDGNTIELWMKKDAYVSDQEYYEIIYDSHVTGTVRTEDTYGRFKFGLATTGTAGNSSDQAMFFEYVSGTTATSGYIGSTTLTTASIADGNWHHYALRVKTEGSNTIFDLFVDGVHDSRETKSVEIGYVSGSIVANIGAAVFSQYDGSADRGARGWCPFSGSIDEFRFWKTWRTSEQIQLRWFDQVGGGTNSDDANTDLGLYYKFNEGITLTSSIDSTVLDYSGRVSNGTWTGYDSTNSRNTGSAINEFGGTQFTGSEYSDPIIYKTHNDFQTFLTNKRNDGKLYDYDNPSNIYYSLPSWIIEEHDANNPDGAGIIDNSLWNLTQILSSYFDDLTNQIKSLTELAQPEYRSSESGSIAIKPIPFANRMLEGKGFVNPEIFTGLDALEYFEDRDSNSLYTEKINDIKNLIYQNIYNNLTYINKSKGTEKSFRNLIRCFGVDDEIYKINLYSNNSVYTLEDNFRSISDRFKFINFNNNSHIDASVFQWSGSVGSPTNPNTKTFISGSDAKSLSGTPPEFYGFQEGAGLPFSVEANITFPERVDAADFNTLFKDDTATRNNYPLILTSSLFGMHTARHEDETDAGWATNDYANFVVRAIKPETYTDKAKFVLTGTAGGFIPELTSSVFDEVYNDKNWSFMVSVYPEQYPNSNQVSGTGPTLSDSAAPGGDYIVEFAGVHRILDSTIHEFCVTGTMTNDQASKFMVSSKRMFVGAHRTGFTGSLIDSTDVKFNNFRVWMNKLTLDDLRKHASDANNYGISRPSDNAYLFNQSINHVYVPNKETLLLHWSFENVTGSDSNGQFIVEDLTSGSVDPLETNRYNWLGPRVRNQYTGLGYEFSASSTDVYVIDELVTAKTNLPEVMSSEDTITVMQSDDEYFERDTRPTFFDLYVEKSLYQNISEEIMKFFSTVKDFNDLYGRPVDRYRGDYKALATLRQLFFDRIKNPPDVDKYVEYFKWFDIAVSSMIQKLAPMSSGLDERPLRNIIESHVLERNKYHSKFPTYEFKQSDPEARLFGVNEMLYDWKHGHAPVDSLEANNCLWWKERAERDDVVITSDDANVDLDRQDILDGMLSHNSASGPSLSGSSGTYQGSTYALRRFTKPYKIRATEAKGYHGGTNFSRNKNLDFVEPMYRQFNQASLDGVLLVARSNTFTSGTCLDDKDLNDKPKINFTVSHNPGAGEIDYVGELIAPYNIVSSTVEQTSLAGVNLVNLHNDSYGYDKEIPMQSPFTEKFVGGKPYRHTWNNFDVEENNVEHRAEGWQIDENSGRVILREPIYFAAASNTDLPRSVFYREETAKRPVNIRNIQQLTGASGSHGENEYTVLGNYSETYEIVMTNGRSINNRYLAESDGDLGTTTTDSTYISGVFDFTLPRRDLTGSTKAIIVNRFSAPGDPATMAEGMLDTAAGEYSVYNALPYRNLNVRLPLQELYSDHANQFGLFSDQFEVAAWDLLDGFTYPGGSSSIHDPDGDMDYHHGTGSFHKVNRNGRRQPKYSNEYTGHDGLINTSASYDNWHVQHQIPQTDIQYAWITASVTSDYTGSALYGFEKPDFSNASLASTDLIFASASDSGTLDPDHDVKVDFAGLNTLILDDVNSTTNVLGSDDYLNDSIVNAVEDGLIANAVLSNRGGPAGGANWKLYRKDNHPIVRALREENRLSYLQNKQIQIDQTTVINTVELASVLEPPVTTKYKPLKHNLKIKKDLVTGEDVSDIQTLSIEHTYLNNIAHFTDHESEDIDLDGKILSNVHKQIPAQTLDSLNYYLLSGEAPYELNPIDDIESLEINETIFPKGQYTYLSGTRQRLTYENSFWRDDPHVRRDRIKSSDFHKNPFNFYTTTFDGGYYVVDQYATGASFVGSQTTVAGSPSVVDNPQVFTASIWSLDAREDFETASPGRIASSSEEGYNYLLGGNFHPIVSASDGSGILQNSMYPYSCYARVSASTLGTNEYRPWLTFALPQYNRKIAGAWHLDTTHEFKFGDTKWEAGSQAGVNPFYDTYSDYIDDAKRTAKGYGMVPEFRISNHMDFYLNDALDGFLTKPTDMLEITGAAILNSDDSDFYKTYSHTDFLKAFDIVSDKYDADMKTSKITLSAEALIKFLPYDGFYPAERTVQLTKLFYESYSASFAVKGDFHLYDINKNAFDAEVSLQEPLPPHQFGTTNPIWKSLFAPGILFNSIKSGISVDYPVHTTASLSLTGEPSQRHTSGYLLDIPRISASFNYRVPFEALLDPEGELGGRSIISSEPHPSASVNVTASLASAGKENYKLAINNFLAATINFFKQDGNLTTLASLADNSQEFANTLDSNTGEIGFTPGKEYKMRLAIYNGTFNTRKTYLDFVQNQTSGYGYMTASYSMNPPTCLMYGQTGSIENSSADYWGSAFGPPCDSFSYLNSELYTPSDPLRNPGDEIYGSGTFEPFTPPYYDGYADIEFTFRPEFEDDYATLSSIIQKLTQSYERRTTGPDAFSLSRGKTAYTERMHLSSSVNIALVHKPTVVYDALGNAKEVADAGINDGSVLTIQPKWETPILNFKDVEVSLPTIGSGSVARGMWHQYGRKPVGEEGIFLQIQDLDKSELDDPTLTGSLARQLGFDQSPFKLGTVAEQKKISEAIVAIPFYVNRQGAKSNFKIQRDYIDVTEQIVDKKQAGMEVNLNTEQPDASIIDMVSKMKKFVIPPHLDFITNKTLDPFAMFIFDFEVKLTEGDLINIWQNLPPDIGRSMKKVEATLPVDIFPIRDMPMLANGLERKEAALLAGLPDNTRWMVFKVKQRAAYNYFTKTADSKDDERFKFNIQIGSQGAEKTSVPDYSYNWPFDFFSLVELGKIDANIAMTPEARLPKGKPAGTTSNKDYSVEVYTEPDTTLPPRGNAPSNSREVKDASKQNKRTVIAKDSKADTARAAARATAAARKAPSDSPVNLPRNVQQRGQQRTQPAPRANTAVDRAKQDALPTSRTNTTQNRATKKQPKSTSANKAGKSSGNRRGNKKPTGGGYR